MAAHGVVDEHPLEGLDKLLERLALGGHCGARIIGIGHQERGDRAGAAAALQDGALGHVDELAHVAGPRGLQKLRRFLRAHLRRIAAVFLGELIAEGGEERQHILAPLAQGRHDDPHGGKTIEEIGAQDAFAGLVLFLKVADGDDTGLGRVALIVDRGHQAGLKDGVQRLDILQNHRAPPRLFDRRDRLVIMGGAEEAAIEGGLVEGRTGDQHEFLRSPRTHRMKSVRNERLAGAGFAFDQHMAVGLPDIEDILAQPLHGGARPDELFHQGRAVRQFLPQSAAVECQAAGLRRLLGQLGHPVGVEGLFEEVIGADPHCLDRHRHIAVAGDHDHRQGRIYTFEFPQKLHPVHAGHLDVGHDNAGIIGA